jgi:hypothetical protein
MACWDQSLSAFVTVHRVLPDLCGQPPLALLANRRLVLDAERSSASRLHPSRRVRAACAASTDARPRTDRTRAQTVRRPLTLRGMPVVVHGTLAPGSSVLIGVGSAVEAAARGHGTL